MSETVLPEPAFGHDEFARRIGMSVWWVRHNMRSIQHVRVGSRVRFTQQDVDAFLDAHRVFPENPLGVTAPPTPTPTRRRRRRA